MCLQVEVHSSHALKYDRIGAAQKNSRMTNTSGLKFPWESGFTGLAATVLSCQQNEIREIHIDGDVSLAMWQYFQATGMRDIGWLGSMAWPVLQGVAQRAVRGILRSHRRVPRPLQCGALYHTRCSACVCAGKCASSNCSSCIWGDSGWLLPVATFGGILAGLSKGS